MPQIKKHLSILLFFTVFTTLLVTPLVHASPALSITVATDNSSYTVGESVSVYEKLTSDDSPVQDGLVALEVDKPSGSSLLFRTLQTGTPPTPAEVNITEVITLDASYQPKDSFNIGDSGIAKIVVKNIYPPILGDINRDGYVNVLDLGYMSDAWLSAEGEPNYNPFADLDQDGYINIVDLGIFSDYWLDYAPVLRVWLTLAMYDGENAPIIMNFVSFQLGAYVSQAWMPSFTIPQNASTGNAAVYACAFTNLPKDGGAPYCPERSKTFQITGSMSSSLNAPISYQTTATYGDYTSTFKMPTYAKNGTYTVYVAATYQGDQATNSTTFEVTTP